MLALSLTVIVYDPAFSELTFLPPLAERDREARANGSGERRRRGGRERGGGEAEARDGEGGGGDERVTGHGVSCGMARDAL